MFPLAALGLFASGVFFLGYELTRRLLARANSRASSVERAVFSIVMGIALWLAIAWALALTRLLTRPMLLTAGAIALIVAVVLRLRRPAPSFDATASRDRLLRALALSPIVIYTGFLLWRGAVAPPLAPDAFTYHLPRAAMIAKTAHFDYFPSIRDNRANELPANYELMLATVIALEGTDMVTEWVSTLMFVLFVLAAAAVTRQWWGPGLHNLAVALAAFAMPSLLLQGAMYKNDAMVSALLLAALLALGRWLQSYDWSAALFLGIAIDLAIGTKPQGGLFAAVAFPVFAYGAFKHLRAEPRRTRALLAIAAIVLLLLPLLGAQAYITAQKMPSVSQSTVIHKVAPVTYGEWSYLWIAPALLVLRPLDLDSHVVTLPWNGEEWLWEREDPYASHYGLLFSLAALAFPFAAWRLRREAGDLPPRARLLITAIAGISFLVATPVVWKHYGYISSYSRYFLYAAVVVFAWTVAPAVQLVQSRVRPRVFWLLLFGFSLLAAQAALHAAKYDKWLPLRDVLFFADHPGTRWIPSLRRAPNVVDMLAGERDKIDVYAGHDTWIYPAFGVTLQRDLRAIDDVSQIRPDADWVIVDRAFSTIWNDPDFNHIRDFRKYLGRGKPTEEDTKIVRALAGDPRFELVYYDQRTTQAIYRRIRR
ncbi:MAG TPA: hypothetical protein VKB93_03055 [Thermoanaerobaculia bacterium]|nr:hypothetical protein [Thermoanaerobaculia bacterium]